MENHKQRGIALVFLVAVILFLGMQFVSARVTGTTGITFANSTSPVWNIQKQENGTVIYISDKHSNTPLICEQYPNAKNKNDLPSRNVYNKKDKDSKKGKEKSDKTSKKTDKIIQQKIGGVWSDCYQVNSGEDFTQIGDNSTIAVEQNYSTTQYMDDSGINTTFILEKYNGISYNYEPNTIWIKTEADCIAMGKEGLCFGATDNSMLDGQLGMFRYEIASTNQLYVNIGSGIDDDGNAYTYPMFYTHYFLPTWGEQQQIYSFEDICSKNYSNCQYSIDNDTATITFVSDKYIDPTVFPGGNGSISNPYQITNCTLLQAMQEQLTSNFILMNNIDCSGINFTPVKLASSFTGSLNGKGYTISNLNINSPGNIKVGLFSSLAGNVNNLNIVNATVSGDYYVGILAGFTTAGTINNCSVIGSSAIATTSSDVGGLVGQSNSIITNSYVINSTVIDSWSGASFVGGLVGYILTGSVSNSGVNNTIVLSNSSLNDYVGGFAGRTDVSLTNDYASNVNVIGGGAGYVAGFVGSAGTGVANISNSWSSGIVSSSGSFTGGFIGRTFAYITNCYSTANVTTSGDTVGGFIGYFGTGGVSNSYSTGLVTRTVAGTYMGGFAGRNAGGTLTSCYYDNQTSNQSDSGKGLGLTTALMKQRNSFVNWDFIDVWSIIENIVYPYLNIRFPTAILNFVFPTPANASTQSNNNIFVNVSSYDSNNLSYYVLTDFNRSLFGWWRLEQGAGATSFTDESSYNNTGVCSGSSCPTPTAGRFGSGQLFNANQQIKLLGSYPNPTDVSISVWMNGASVLSAIRTVYSFEQTSGLNNIYLHIDTLGRLRLVNYNSTTFTIISNSKSVNANQWYHTVVTMNSTTGCLYVDSVMINCTAISMGTNFSKVTYMSLGSIYGVGSYWNGTLDEVAVFKRALTQSEISSLYNATAYQYNNNFTNLSLGNYTFQSFSVNTLGNENQTELRTVTISNFVDVTPPNVTLISPINNSFNNTAMQNFTFNVTDDTGLKNATIYIYNSSGGLYNKTTTIFSGTAQSIGIPITLIEGIYNWFVTVFDNFGNSFTTQNNTVTIDLTNPSISITYPINNGYYATNVSTINYIANDTNYNQCWYSTNNGVTNSTKFSYGTNFTGVISIEGSNTWIVWCNDLAGNVNSSSVFFIKDTTPPSFNIFSNATINYSQSLSVQFNITDVNNVSSVIVNDTRFSITNTGLLTNATSLSVGTYIINIIANDTLGNQNSIIYQININKMSPIILLTYDKTSPQTYGTNITPTCTALGEASPILIMNGNVITSGSQLTLGAGSYTFNCSYPATQNYSYKENVSVFVISAAASSTDAIFVPASPIAYGTYSNWTCLNFNGINAQMFVDGINKTNEMGLNILRGTGNYVINCSIPPTQNYSSSSTIRNYTITSTTPTLNLTSSNWSIGYGNQVNLSGSCPSQITCNLYVNGNLVSNPYNNVYSFGNYSVTYNTTGNQNYTNTSVQTILEIYDKINPNINLINPENVNFYDSYNYIRNIPDSSYQSINNDMYWTLCNGSTNICGYNIINNFNLSKITNSGTIGPSHITSYGNRIFTGDGGVGTVYVTNATNMSYITQIHIPNSFSKYVNDICVDDNYILFITTGGYFEFWNATTYAGYGYTKLEPVGGTVGSTTEMGGCWLSPQKDYAYLIGGSTGYQGAPFDLYVYNYTTKGLITNIDIGRGGSSGSQARIRTDSNNLYFANISSGSSNLMIYNLTKLKSNGFNFTQSYLTMIPSNSLGRFEIQNGSLYMTDSNGLRIYNTTDFSLLVFVNGTASNNTKIWDASSEISLYKNYIFTVGYGGNNVLLKTINANITNYFASNNATQNFTYNVSDIGSGLKNSTLYIYNQTGIISQVTTTFTNTFTSIVGIPVTLADGIYNWFADIFDLAGNKATSQNSTLLIDTTNPSLVITYPIINQKYNTNVSSISYIANDTNYNQCWYSTNNGITNSTKVNYGNNFTNIISNEGSNTWKVWCNDLLGNVNSSSITFLKDTINPDLIVLEPQGETQADNTNVYFGTYANDLNNISFIGATVIKPDNTTDSVIMDGMLSSSDFQNQMGFLEKNVGTGQTCTGQLTGSAAITTLLGDGTPQSDNTCSLIGTRSVFGDFDSTMYYGLNNLSLDSAINFQITSGVPTSANAINYAYIGRTNFAGEGDSYEVFGTDINSSGFLIKTDTNDTYGAMRIKRVGNNFSFYVLNNTDSSWILLASHYYSFGNVFFLVESEDIADNFGTASVNWTNYSIATSPNYYLGIYTNTSQAGFYNVTFFTNDSFGNTKYAYSNFNILQAVNYPPSVPFVLTPIDDGLYNKNVTIAWSQVSDADNSPVTFNISLLNQDFSFNRTIIENYGNLSSYSYVWDSTTTPDGNYSIKVEVRETSTPDHFTQSDTLSGYFMLHNTPPSFNNVPSNASIDYNQPLNVQFNVSSDFNYTLSTNDSRFNIDQFGLLTNATTLGGQVYNIIIMASDIIGNLNSLIYKIIVNPIPQPVSLNINETSPITYGKYVNVTCDGNLYRNGVPINSEMGQSILLLVGNYTYYCEKPATQNYTLASTSQMFRVNPVLTSSYLYLNGVRGNLIINTNQTLTISSLLNDGVGNISLYINGNFSGFNTNITKLSSGYYNITAIFFGNQNYISSSETWFVTSTTNILTPKNTTITFNKPGQEIQSSVVPVGIMLDVTINNSDGIATQYYRINNGTNISFTNPVVLQMNSYGNYTLTVCAIDNYAITTCNSTNFSLVYATGTQVIVNANATYPLNVNQRLPITLSDAVVNYTDWTYGKDNTLTIHTYDSLGNAVDVDSINIQILGNVSYTEGNLVRLDTGVYQKTFHSQDGNDNLPVQAKVSVIQQDKIVAKTVDLTLKKDMGVGITGMSIANNLQDFVATNWIRLVMVLIVVIGMLMAVVLINLLFIKRRK